MTAVSTTASPTLLEQFWVDYQNWRLRPETQKSCPQETHGWSKWNCCNKHRSANRDLKALRSRAEKSFPSFIEDEYKLTIKPFCTAWWEHYARQTGTVLKWSPAYQGCGKMYDTLFQNGLLVLEE